MRVTTPDGAELAVHHLHAGDPAPVTLLAHATGFHGRCWRPVADELGMQVWALDFRGFGDSAVPAAWQVDWAGYGSDALETARALVERTGTPVLGVGHSMGGAALAIAALAEPGLFTGLVLFEPVIMPPAPPRDERTPTNHLATGARRRRAVFESHDAALANFAAKPPMNAFTPAALEAYVRDGLASGSDGQVHLKCTPEHEARTYETGGDHDTFERLGELQVPTCFLSGRVEPAQPSAVTELLARRTPGAVYRRLDRLSHFGPMEDPAAIAAEISGFAAALAR